VLVEAEQLSLATALSLGFLDSGPPVTQVAAACFVSIQPTCMTQRFAPLLTCIVVALTFSGCASFNRIADYPTPRQPSDVAIVAKPMSKMNELPLGAFYDEPRQIIISGHQKGLGWGMVFGIVGVMVADSANKSGAEKRFGDSARSSATDLGTITQEALEQEIAGNPTATWQLHPAPAHLLLSPYAVFTVQKSGQARLHAMLRAEILGADGKPTWSARYFARAEGEHTIEGEDGWMNGTRFADGMRGALQRVIKVCIDDTQGKLTGSRTIKAKGLFPFLNTDKIELPFIVVQESEQSIVGRLAAGDVMVMAGTHVLDKSDFTITDAKFKDPRK
jgi:hypothetical protein